jgi:hypothetical protein
MTPIKKYLQDMPQFSDAGVDRERKDENKINI